MEFSQRTEVDYLLRGTQDVEAVKRLDGQIDGNFQELVVSQQSQAILAFDSYLIAPGPDV
jgi:hypothetical protein